MQKLIQMNGTAFFSNCKNNQCYKIYGYSTLYLKYHWCKASLMKIWRQIYLHERASKILLSVLIPRNCACSQVLHVQEEQWKLNLKKHFFVDPNNGICAWRVCFHNKMNEFNCTGGFIDNYRVPMEWLNFKLHLQSNTPLGLAL